MVPGAVQGARGLGGSVLYHGANIGMPLLFGVQALYGVREKVRQGANPVSAIVGGAADLTFSVLAPNAYMAFTLGLPAVRALSHFALQSVTQRDTQSRLARTPFSHRFEHSDVTSRMQQAGMQAIGAAWGHSRLGSEASSFARRYAR